MTSPSRLFSWQKIARTEPGNASRLLKAFNGDDVCDDHGGDVVRVCDSAPSHVFFPHDASSLFAYGSLHGRDSVCGDAYSDAYDDVCNDGDSACGDVCSGVDKVCDYSDSNAYSVDNVVCICRSDNNNGEGDHSNTLGHSTNEPSDHNNSGRHSSDVDSRLRG